MGLRCNESTLAPRVYALEIVPKQQDAEAATQQRPIDRLR
jgi:hypothetical protein